MGTMSQFTPLVRKHTIAFYNMVIIQIVIDVHVLFIGLQEGKNELDNEH